MKKIFWIILLTIIPISLIMMLWDYNPTNIENFWEKVLGTDLIIIFAIGLIYALFFNDDNDDDNEVYGDKIMI